MNGENVASKLFQIPMVWVFGDRLDRNGRPFSKNLWFEEGNGTRVKFWHGVLCGDCPLKNTFPELFSFSNVKESLIADVLQLSTRVRHWGVRFSRLVQDWELESLVSFIDLIYSKFVKGEGMDRLCWKPAKSWGFEVHGYYYSLSSTNVGRLWITCSFIVL